MLMTKRELFKMLTNPNTRGILESLMTAETIEASMIFNKLQGHVTRSTVYSYLKMFCSEGIIEELHISKKKGERGKPAHLYKVRHKMIKELFLEQLAEAKKIIVNEPTKDSYTFQDLPAPLVKKGIANFLAVVSDSTGQRKRRDNVGQEYSYCKEGAPAEVMWLLTLGYGLAPWVSTWNVLPWTDSQLPEPTDTYLANFPKLKVALDRLKEKDLITIGGPSNNLFTRNLNKFSIFRFYYDMDPQDKAERWRYPKGITDPFMDYPYDTEPYARGEKPALGIISLMASPYNPNKCAIMVAGTIALCTSEAIKILANQSEFGNWNDLRKRPLGGVFEVRYELCPKTDGTFGKEPLEGWMYSPTQITWLTRSYSVVDLTEALQDKLDKHSKYFERLFEKEPVLMFLDKVNT